jgi:hypothetical protein
LNARSYNLTQASSSAEMLKNVIDFRPAASSMSITTTTAAILQKPTKTASTVIKNASNNLARQFENSYI